MGAKLARLDDMDTDSASAKPGKLCIQIRFVQIRWTPSYYPRTEFWTVSEM